MSVEILAIRLPRRATGLIEKTSWKEPAEHNQTIRGLYLPRLFIDVPHRAERLCVDATGISPDYLENRVTDEAIRLLTNLTVECDVNGLMDPPLGGERISLTETSAVPHKEPPLTHDSLTNAHVCCYRRYRGGRS